MCKANPTNYFFAFLLLPLLFSCGENKGGMHANTVPAGGQFVMLVNDPVETLDPKKILYESDWEASFLVYEGLVGYTDSLNRLEPLLADHWEYLDGGSILRFHLRNNVRFHDNPCFPNGIGREVVAGDVAFMLERLADPDEPSYYYGLFSKMVLGMEEYHSGKAASIAGFVVLDEYTFELHLSKPFAVFLKLLATPAAYIIPREATAFYGADFLWNPVGTGPFQLAVWKPIEELVFVRNQHYWGRDSIGNSLPYLDAVTMRIATGDTDHLSEFLKGNTHKLVLMKHELAPLMHEPGFLDAYNIYENKNALGVRFFGIRSGTGHMFAKNALLRRAVANRFDRSFIERAAEGGYIVSQTFVPRLLLMNPQATPGRSQPDSQPLQAVLGTSPQPNDLAYSDNGTLLDDHTITGRSINQVDRNITSPHTELKSGAGPYPRSNQDFSDPTASDSILDDRPLIVASSIGSMDLEHLANTMNALGIRTEKVVQPMNYYKYIVAGEPDIFRVSMTPSFPDPIDYYSLLYSGSPPNLNLMGYHNPDFDALFEQSMIEADPVRRTMLHMEMEKIISDDVPVLLLSHTMPDYIILPAGTAGFTFRYMFPDYRHIRFTNPDVHNHEYPK